MKKLVLMASLVLAATLTIPLAHSSDVLVRDDEVLLKCGNEYNDIVARDALSDIFIIYPRYVNMKISEPNSYYFQRKTDDDKGKYVGSSSQEISRSITTIREIYLENLTLKVINISENLKMYEFSLPESDNVKLTFSFETIGDTRVLSITSKDKELLKYVLSELSIDKSFISTNANNCLLLNDELPTRAHGSEDD
jgi:hypothetical protein